MEAFLRQLDAVFDLEAGTVQAGDVFKALDGWDSLVALGLMTTVAEEYHTTISNQEIQQARTAADLWALIQQKTGGGK
jgi:acyl carrier protein